MDQSLIRDRDLVLAHSLQRPEHARKIVGVVGAGHVRGIRQHWDAVQTPESRAAYEDALLARPSDCDAPRIWDSPYVPAGALAAALVAGAHPAVRRDPTSLAAVVSRGFRFAVGATAVVGAGAAVAAGYALVGMGRVATRWEAAARRAEEEGLAPRTRGELRSRRWRAGGDGGDGDGGGGGGGTTRTLEVRATNAVGPYASAASRMLYRD
jgi:hypothetical protein